MDTRSEIFTEIAKINFWVTEVSHIMGCNACVLYCSEAFGQYNAGAVFLLSNLPNYEVSPSLTKQNYNFLCQKETQIFFANLFY